MIERLLSACLSSIQCWERGEWNSKSFRAQKPCSKILRCSRNWKTHADIYIYTWGQILKSIFLPPANMHCLPASNISGRSGRNCKLMLLRNLKRRFIQVCGRNECLYTDVNSCWWHVPKWFAPRGADLKYVYALVASVKEEDHPPYLLLLLLLISL